jgi:hypothetical protein
MNDDTAQAGPPETGQFYEIRIAGILDPLWHDWFGDLEIRYSDDEAFEGAQTVLSGTVNDQAALHGLLTKVRDLNLSLIAVNRKRQKGGKV